MKKNPDFMLSDVADSTVLIPFGDMALSFNGIVTLNETAKFLWENLGDSFEEQDIVDLILKSYADVDEATAKASAEKFVSSLKEAGAIQ